MSSLFSESPKKIESPKIVLIEGKDYYIEKGYYVFTADYLQQRGYCCGNQCRHCPYGNDWVKK